MHENRVGNSMANKLFSKYFFFFLFLLFSQTFINTVYAAEAKDQESFFTPGKTLSGKVGSQLLSLKPDIIEIFDEEEVNKEYGILFENPARIEESDFKGAISRLERRLRKLLSKGGKDSQKINSSFLEIAKIRYDIGGVPGERLEHYAEEYFKKMEGFEGIDFRAKPGGDQLGAKAIVHLSGKPSIFYIKSHSSGHKSTSRSSGAHPLDPIELMVYALLEQLGDGPKVHFFGRDDKTAFIATEYAGDKDTEFYTYEYFLKDEGRKKALWGKDVYNYINDTHPADIEVSGFMKIIEENPQSIALADKFTRVDILSRVFRLSDLIGNRDNFGFSLNSDGTIRHSIIDFRIISDERGEYYISEGNLEGFYNGNGIFSPPSVDPFVRHVLKERTAATRSKNALPHIEEIQKSLSEISEVALRRVMDYIEKVKDNIKDGENFKETCQKALTEYKQALLHNADMYLKYLRAGAPKIKPIENWSFV